MEETGLEAGSSYDGGSLFKRSKSFVIALSLLEKQHFRLFHENTGFWITWLMHIS